MLILRAAQQVVAEEDFDSMLDQTRDRVDEIEGEFCVLPVVGKTHKSSWGNYSKAVVALQGTASAQRASK